MRHEQPDDSSHSRNNASGQPVGGDQLTPDDLLLMPAPDHAETDKSEAPSDSQSADGGAAAQRKARAAGIAASLAARATLATEAQAGLTEHAPPPVSPELDRSRLTEEELVGFAPDPDRATPTDEVVASDPETGLSAPPDDTDSIGALGAPLANRLAGWRAGPQAPEALAEPARRPLSKALLRDLPVVRLSTHSSPARWVPAALSMAVVVAGVASAAWVLDTLRDPVLAGLVVSMSVTLAAFFWIWKRR